ncbi:MAG: ATP synthase F0 subunit B [Dehalococcoidia bacterium]|nr:ATP synthase F0 subunit B [Dehalococcoidia bacterium]
MEALGINLPGLIAQLINFGLLFYLLRRFAFPRITAMLDERAERIRESLEAAERARQDAAASQANVQTQLDEARRVGQAIIEQTTRAAEQLRIQLMEEAQKEREAFLARARAEFSLERDKGVAELRRQFADLTIAAAERVINESLDASKHQRIVAEVLEQSRLN